ncbi:MAG TPA: DNA polymerase III subunit alpha [Candidatus Eisenbacteria bacterium]|jgi:DNA-directed DNA polymerase III PolC
MTAFVPLRVRSHGSLLWGTTPPEALIERAQALGYGALALTDRDNLYLAIRFYRAARAHGMTPLLGAELTHGHHAALVLPLDRLGYANLCRLITLRHLDRAFDLARAIPPHADGLHVIVESSGLAASLLAAGVPPADGAVLGSPQRQRSPRGRGGLWLGIRGLPTERIRLRDRAAASRWLGVPLVATGDCTLGTPDEHEAHRVAVTAAAGELLERMPPGSFCAAEAWLAAPSEWARRVRAACAGAGVPEMADAALGNNRALAERCRLELDLGVPIFPRAPVPEGETGPGYLLRLGREGVARRYGTGSRGGGGALRARAGARLEWELGLIDRLGFTGYFLLVADIVQFARHRGIPTVGRGSGAGSIVAYCLGITNVDPLRYGLYFERFLHPGRRDCPDLDIDLCWQRRDEVIAHVYETYGTEQVAMIATHATLGPRSAFRETAKALGVPHARVNALARHVPGALERPYLRNLLAAADGGGGRRGVDWREPPLPDALRLAERLEGAPRHLSIHCGGVVIGDRPLPYYVPLERAAKGIVVTQFEMRAIEAVGLVKMDLLGNRALTTIGECVSLVRGREAADLDLERLPDPDPETARRLSAGDTLSCFQLESPAMRNLLRMLEARTLDETIAAVALVRPGPAESGMKEAFCRRHRGLEPAAFLHPRLEPALRATHGVMLYEEDVMCVAAALSGLALADGDELRRAISAARSDEEFRALERGFVARAAAAGVEAEVAGAVWRELARFAAYAFCKAHAAGYGALAYQSAYLRAHFPTEYAVGVLNHHAGMYATWVHVEDLRRLGVRFLAPCVQRSGWNTVLEEVSAEGPSGRGVSRGTLEAASAEGPQGVESPAVRPRRAVARDGGGPTGCSEPEPDAEASVPRETPRPECPSAPACAAVRLGLGRVVGLARATGERIVAERARRPFRSLADFADRARPTPPELEALVLAGALDWTRRTRPSLLLEARAGAHLAVGRAHPAPALVAPNGAELLPEAALPLDVPALDEFDLADRVRGEIQATGLWFSAHPLDVLVPGTALEDATPAITLPEHVGRRVRVVGLPCAHRRVETKTGGQMLFLTLADKSGVAESVLFPGAYRSGAWAVRGQVVRVEGRVQETLGALTVNAERAEALA